MEFDIGFVVAVAFGVIDSDIDSGSDLLEEPHAARTNNTAIIGNIILRIICTSLGIISSSVVFLNRIYLQNTW